MRISAVCVVFELRISAVYLHSLLTEPSAPTTRPPAGGSLRSPTPPAARCARPQRGIVKKFEKISPIFFFFFFVNNFFLLFRAGGERSERGGVGERSEPPAGGLAVGAEGSVNSECY